MEARNGRRLEKNFSRRHSNRHAARTPGSANARLATRSRCGRVTQRCLSATRRLTHSCETATIESRPKMARESPGSMANGCLGSESRCELARSKRVQHLPRLGWVVDHGLRRQRLAEGWLFLQKRIGRVHSQRLGLDAKPNRCCHMPDSRPNQRWVPRGGPCIQRGDSQSASSRRRPPRRRRSRTRSR